MDTAAALVARANALAEAFAAARLQVGLEGKKIAAGEAKRVAGADTKFGHWRKGRPGPKMSSGFEVEGDDVVLNPRPKGIWAFAEAGARAHTIPRRKSIRRTRRGVRIVNGVKLPGMGEKEARPFVPHPGTSGWGAWSKVRPQVVEMAPAVVIDAIAKALADG